MLWRMASSGSITIVKEFSYRGKLEEWSNNYHFLGTPPASDTEWQALGQAIFNLEKPFLGQQVRLVQIYGYSPLFTVSVAQIDLHLTSGTPFIGTRTTNVTDRLAGDQAVMLRAQVGNSVKGKKVYIRKFWHGSAASTTDPDQAAGDVVTAMNNAGGKLTDGTLPGGAKWCSPNGVVGVTPQASPFLTTRTLKRRGKRPSPSTP